MLKYWNKFLHWLIGAVIASILLCVASWYFFNVNALVKTVELLISAWGTAAVACTVIWALFGDELKASIELPDPRLNVTNKRPHCYLVGKNSPKSSSDTGEVLEIYGEIKNPAKKAAVDCEVLCNAIYASTNGNDKSFHCISSFCHSSFKWIDGNKTMLDVAMPVSRFFRLAVIANNTNIDACGDKLINAEIKTVDTNKSRNGKNSKKSANKILSENIGDIEDKKSSTKATDIAIVRINLPDRAMKREYMTFDSRYHHFILPVSIAWRECGTATRSYVLLQWSGQSISDYSKPGMLEITMRSFEEIQKLIADGETLEEV